GVEAIRRGAHRGYRRSGIAEARSSIAPPGTLFDRKHSFRFGRRKSRGPAALLRARRGCGIDSARAAPGICSRRGEGGRSAMSLTPQAALDLFHSDDLIGIGMAANEMRRSKTDARVATYQIDRNINYTNFCTEYCSFCAFYRPMGSKDGYVLPLETIFQKIEETIALGGTGILLQGGLNPELPMEFYEKMLSSIKQRFPQIHLHCFSAPEIICISEVAGLSIRDTIARLRDAGLDSIPGGGAEILDDEVRARISRLKCRSDEWEAVHRAAHSLGMRTTATMMFGCGEETRHRVNHFERIRRIQQETGGFTAFIPWIFAPENTPLGKKIPETTAFDYLKTLAISRLYLDN